jgi:hypothetical protein
MTQTGQNGNRDDKKPNKKGRRSDRLAAALRENLRRRKAQERQRSASLGAGSPQDRKTS